MFGIMFLILTTSLVCGIAQIHEKRKIKRIEKSMENRNQKRQKQIEEYIESKKYIKLR